MSTLEGRTAVITGAASGIGRGLAVVLATKGCALALSDVDVDGLDETARLAKDRGARDVLVAVVDVADRSAVEAHADEVVARYGEVHAVFANAGVALFATAEDHRPEDIDWLLGINLHGVIHTSQAFLPHLVASGDGHLVNISSVFGLLGIPTQSIYNAAKFGVRGYTEALAAEMIALKRPVQVHTVHPGGIDTEIARNARASGTFNKDANVVAFERLGRTSPEKAAQIIIAGVEANRRRILVGADAHLINAIAKIAGSLYIPVLGRIARPTVRRLTAKTKK